MSRDEVAAIIERERADEAISALKEAGIYDAHRRVEPYGDTRLAIPVTTQRPLSIVDHYESDLATQKRRRTLEDHLRARGWSEEALRQVPSSYARIGDLIVVSEQLTDRRGEIGEALLDLHADATTVVHIEDIAGERRRPSVSHVAGERRTTTVHREHGLSYALDLSEVMFSPGNQHERTRMRSLVSPGERVLDLCAGIGYFTLPMADGGAEITAIERNPEAFRWLSRNVTLNGFDAAITPVRGDCRTLSSSAERAVIGYLPVHDCRDDPMSFGGGYLDSAIHAVEHGWVHVHGIAWADDHTQAKDEFRRRLTRRGVELTDCSIRRVKGFAPSTDHIVIDAHITRS